MASPSGFSMPSIIFQFCLVVSKLVLDSLELIESCRFPTGYFLKSKPPINKKLCLSRVQSQVQ